MAETPEERRRHSRFPVLAPLPCLVKVQGYDEKTPPLEGKLRNLSAGGALLELGRRVPPGATVMLSVDTTTGLIQMECQVLWVAGGTARREGATSVHGLEFPPGEGGPDPVIEDLLRHYSMTSGGGTPGLDPEAPA